MPYLLLSHAQDNQTAPPPQTKQSLDSVLFLHPVKTGSTCGILVGISPKFMFCLENVEFNEIATWRINDMKI